MDHDDNDGGSYDVDHSCSTPLERLVRDVETCLKRWHLGDGADRHVSVHDHHHHRLRSSNRFHNRLGRNNEMPLHHRTRQGLPDDDDDDEEEEDCDENDDAAGVGGEGSVASSSHPSSSKSSCSGESSVSTLKVRNTTRSSSAPNIDSHKKLPPHGGAAPAKKRGRWASGPAANANKSRSSNKPRSSSSTAAAARRKSDASHGGGQVRVSNSGDGGAACGGGVSDRSSSCNDDGGVRVIRSSRLTYRPVVVDPSFDRRRRPLNVPLTLTLWDGPPPPPASPSTSSCGTGDSGGSGVDEDDPLPWSLRSDPYVSVRSLAAPSSMATIGGGDAHRRRKAVINDNEDDGIATDISALFGIGQHVTLCPVEDDDDDGTINGEGAEEWYRGTVRSLISLQRRRERSSDGNGRKSRYNRRRDRKDDCEFAGEEDDEETRIEAISALSTVLQTAVTLAAGGCKCRLPVFGLWGTYRPGGGCQIGGFGGDEMMSVPSWLDGRILPYSAPLTRQTPPLPQSQSPNRAGGGGDDRRAAYVRDRSSSSAHRDGSQQELSSSLPPDGAHSSSSFSGGGNGPYHLSRPMNHRQSGKRLQLPPVLSGTCLCDDPRGGGGKYFCGDDSRLESAKFVAYVVPPGIEAPFRCDTLNGLGEILLAHCPQRQRSGGVNRRYGSVVLLAARHRYRWDRDRIFDAVRMGRNSASLLFRDEYEVEGYHPETDWRRVGETDMTAPVDDDGDGASSSSSSTSAKPTTTATKGGNNIDEEVEEYRKRCRRHALSLLERAASAPTDSALGGGVVTGSPEPLWGPPDDPLLSVSVTASWGGVESTTSGGGVGRRRSSGNVSTHMDEERDKDKTMRGPEDEAGGGENDTSSTRSPSAAMADQPTPLLALPLRVRSNRHCSTSDALEIESALRSAVLDPRAAAPGRFSVSVRFDPDAPCTALSASNRCILAALVRAGTLGLDALPGHLVNADVLAGLAKGTFGSNNETTNRGSADKGATTMDDAAEEAIRRAGVGPVTRRLVRVMDWDGAADRLPDRWELRKMLHDVLDGGARDAFPSPPEGIFRWDGLPSSTSLPETETLHPSLPKAAPPGRLLSVLFVHMSKLRTPSSMAALWIAFVDEMRNRWDRREGLPNLGRVPGLDHPASFSGGRGERIGIGIGHKAEHAAFVNSSEVDPDRNQCLAGQKLQVFNIGVECTIASEALQMVRDNTHHDGVHSQGGAASDAATDVVNNGTGRAHDTQSVCTGRPTVAETHVSLGSVAPVPDSSLETHKSKKSGGDTHALEDNTKLAHELLYADGDLVNADEDGRKRRLRASSPTDGSSSVRDEFFDTLESPEKNSSGGSAGDNEGKVLFAPRAHEEISMNVAQRQSRRGARCPIPGGVNLIASGDQMYAPYLQRTQPLTEELILQRRSMLSQNGSDGDSENGDRVQSRIMIAQRLQKQKLLSDMQAFKASNPGAVFQDFINWYGNPGNPLNPLDGFDDGGDTASPILINTKNAKTPAALDEASEAIQILMATRSFWSDTWDEALPCPAAEQKPLFDAFSSVEMVLHSFETMHPAMLVNQVLAINFAIANFVLNISAGPARKVGKVRLSLDRLVRKTEEALLRLSKDAIDAAFPSSSRKALGSKPVGTEPLSHVSIATIALCEGVCNAIGDAEILLARATTLLDKFPGEYELVQKLLRRGDGEAMVVDSPDGRSGIIDAIRKQEQIEGQIHHETDMDEVPRASVREYVLRNQDLGNPCQLSARIGEDTQWLEDGEEAVATRGGMFLGLSRCK